MKSAFPRFSPEWWAWMTMPEPNTGCLLWMGCVCRNGYGRVAYNKASGKVLVHRIAYESAYGPFDSSRHVCHRCDTPSCVNPDHLFLGTQKENMRDMFAKGRARPHGVRTPALRIERTVAPAVMSREVSSANSNSSVMIAYDLHHIRTTVMVADWRHVTGVPAERPTEAIVLQECPLLGTVESAVTGWPVNPAARVWRDAARVDFSAPLLPSPCANSEGENDQ